MEQTTHIYDAEYGGLAASCGLLPALLPGRRGAMDLDALRAAIRKAAAGFPERALVCLENTHNAAGGTVMTPAYTDQVCEIAHAAGLPVHLDGARLFNAAVALGVEARELTRSVDSLQFCISKGLSCPIGSLLVGRRDFIARARRIRKMMGGAMRQAGIIAAPGLVALHSGIARLAEDHANARRLAEGLTQIAGLRVDMQTVQTNMVRADVAGLGIDSPTFDRYLTARGVRCMIYPATGIRCMTYRGVAAGDIEQALDIIRGLVAARPWENETIQTSKEEER